MPPIITISNVSKSFIKDSPPALNDISAKIPRGQIIGLAGPDGAGKTTLIRLIAGLLLPTQGTITVDGHDTVTGAAFIHSFTGYMPQKFGLYEDLTVQQNLNLYADLTGVTGQERVDVFEKLMSFTTLKPFLNRLAGNLSGGMKQKLGLACALVRKPVLLLLDEPSVGVDPISRRELWKMVQELLKEGITVIWSTAYLDEAERCDTILLLDEGKLLYYGPPNDMTKRVQGRVYMLSNIQGNRRKALMQTLGQPDVIDAVIQGENLRVVLKNTKPFSLDLNRIDPTSKIEISHDHPRFEDAYIDILGGGPKSGSILAEKTPPILDLKDNVVNAQDLTKKFGSFTAANHICFKVRSGEVFGLLGPNGAGKSTTFKMMCGLLKPTSGDAYINGLNLQKAPGKARAHIGYMAQKFSLYGNLSVLQNLVFFSGIYNLSGRDKQDAIQQMIEIFNLKDYLNESTDSLPLGYKQRLALSCAVMHRPVVLFLDEPTAGVDPITRREFWSHINGLVEKGITIMVTTHFMDEAEFCDRIGLIYQSNLIEMGTPAELKAKAKTSENPAPTLEDAFIYLIENYGGKEHG
ncbi:MAG: ABC transporter ATP-binding protein [Parachlamydiaceae bacterium]|nr:ABC transporter ATP-binding protein [Parachlamydiaceae bacterium]